MGIDGGGLLIGPGGVAPTRIVNQQSTCISPPIFFTPDALPATTLTIYPGLGQG